MIHKIKFYPVENGDTTLFTLKDSTTILIDCKIRAGAEDPDDDSKFDVKKDLLLSIQKRDNNPFIDTFILTHGDRDHCHGFGTNFYQGDPKDYGKSNRENGQIIIDELWVTSALFTYDQSVDGNAVRTEANRRIKLWDNNDSSKNKNGNRIFLIGYDESEKFKKILFYIPGNTVKTFNGKEMADFEIFIHAPFKDSLIQGKADKDRNSTSIAFQARFKASAIDKDFTCRVLIGGDSDHYIWEQILDKSIKYKNENYLKYNIFLAPHHCSWTFFNNVSYDVKENQIPKEYSLKILSYKLPGAYIIASSKKIVNEKPNPPHYPAREEYISALGNSSNFLSTAVNPSEEKPEPIEFIVETNGPKLVTKDKDVETLKSISRSGVVKQPWAK